MIATNVITQILGPLFTLIGAIFAFIYSVIPNYAIMIVLTTMVLLLPFTPLITKSVKSSAAMQKIAPQLKRISELYKNDPAKRQEETMALFKKEGVSPFGSCLPLTPQFVVLYVFYYVLRVLTNIVGGKHPHAQPLYINTTTKLYHDLVAAHGQMIAFGVNFSIKITAPHGSFTSALPYWAILVVGGLLQYFQVQRMFSRMPSTSVVNAQAQFLSQKVLPLITLVFYFLLPTGVCLYYLTSTVVRFIQYEWVYFRHPGLSKGDVNAPPRHLFGNRIETFLSNLSPKNSLRANNNESGRTIEVVAEDINESPEEKRLPDRDGKQSINGKNNNTNRSIENRKTDSEKSKNIKPHPRSKSKKERKER